MVDAEFHLCSCQLGRLHDVSQSTTPSCPTVVAVGTFQSAHGKASMRECLRLSDIRSRAGCPSMRTIFLLDYDDVDCAAQCGRIYRVPALGDDAGDRAHILHCFCSRLRPSSLAGGSDSSSWTELSVPEIERIVRPLQVAIASSPRQETYRTTWRGISWWSKRGDGAGMAITVNACGLRRECPIIITEACRTSSGRHCPGKETVRTPHVT
jgi:hypothetical protein